MSRGAKLALLLAVILILSAAAFFLITGENKKAAEEKAAADALAAEEEMKMPENVFFIDPSNIDSLKWTCLAKFGEAERKGDGWIVKDDDGNEYDCDQAKIDTMLNALRMVKAERVIENPGDLGQFGMNEPCAVIEIRTKDKVYTLTVGDPCQSNKEQYYCINSTDENLYLISDAFAQTFYLMRGELLPQAQ